MLKKIRNKRGFTLIELMIVVAIVGILAAIAIPAYIDYTIKAKLSEVANSFDALATAASEYHASMGFWSTQPPDELVALPNRRAVIVNSGVAGNSVTYTGTIDNIASAVDHSTLTLTITYDSARGYSKTWGGSIPAKYMPRE